MRSKPVPTVTITDPNPTPSRGEMPILDNPFAPEVFTEGALGFFMRDGNVHVTFTAPRADHRLSPGPVNRVVVGRIVMPAGGACGLALGLYEFLKKNGVDPVEQGPGGTMQ